MFKRLANFKFNWKLSLFTLLLFPVLISLGKWQLSREQEKIALQDTYALRQAAPSISLDELDRGGDLLYVRLHLQGEFKNDHSFLLDNKVNAGKVGFEVITPFLSNGNELFFVNRGWVTQGQYRTDIPVFPEVVGSVNVNAVIYVPVGKQVMLGADEQSTNWPRLIQSLEPEQMIKQLPSSYSEHEIKLFPYSLRIDENNPGVLERNWSVVSTTPEKHRGYAVQWFIMAAVLLLLYFFSSTNNNTSEDKKRK